MQLCHIFTIQIQNNFTIILNEEDDRLHQFLYKCLVSIKSSVTHATHLISLICLIQQLRSKAAEVGKKMCLLCLFPMDYGNDLHLNI